MERRQQLFKKCWRCAEFGREDMCCLISCRKRDKDSNTFILRGGHADAIREMVVTNSASKAAGKDSTVCSHRRCVDRASCRF